MSSTKTRLTVAAGVVIIALTAAAFWLSYAHLHDVAASSGLGGSPARAWAWPATLDLFIIAGEILMLVAALNGKRDPWAIGLTVTGSIGSIGLNVYGVGHGAELIEYIVAAVPPAAALLAFGALMRQIHTAIAEPDAAPTVDDYVGVVAQTVETLAKEAQIPAELFTQPSAADAARTAAAIEKLTTDMATAAYAHSTPQVVTAKLDDALEELEALEKDVEPLDDEDEDAPDVASQIVQVHRITSKPSVQDIAAAVDDIQRSDQDLTGKALAVYFGVSDRSGRRYLNTWEDATQPA